MRVHYIILSYYSLFLGAESPLSITKNSVELAAGATSSAINTGAGIVIVSASGTSNIKVAIVGYGSVTNLNDYGGIALSSNGVLGITIKNNLSDAMTFYYKVISA